MCTDQQSLKRLNHMLHEQLYFQVDNLIILSDGMTLDSNEGKAVTTFLKKYRRMVNNDLLFVSVDLSGSAPGYVVKHLDVYNFLQLFLSQPSRSCPIMHASESVPIVSKRTVLSQYDVANYANCT